jgi:hypothetical protein
MEIDFQQLLNETATKLGFVNRSNPSGFAFEKSYYVGDRRFLVSCSAEGQIRGIQVFGFGLTLQFSAERSPKVGAGLGDTHAEIDLSDEVHAEIARDALAAIDPESEATSYVAISSFLEERGHMEKAGKIRAKFTKHLDKALEFLPFEEVEEIFRARVANSVHKS